jgi:ribosomal protein S21
MYVEVTGNTQQALQNALRKFTKQVKDSGIMEDLKKKEHYLKKSIRLKHKRNDALKQRIRDQKKLERKKDYKN